MENPVIINKPMVIVAYTIGLISGQVFGLPLWPWSLIVVLAFTTVLYAWSVIFEGDTEDKSNEKQKRNKE